MYDGAPDWEHGIVHLQVGTGGHNVYPVWAPGSEPPATTAARLAETGYGLLALDPAKKTLTFEFRAVDLQGLAPDRPDDCRDFLHAHPDFVVPETARDHVTIYAPEHYSRRYADAQGRPPRRITAADPTAAPITVMPFESTTSASAATVSAPVPDAATPNTTAPAPGGASPLGAMFTGSLLVGGSLLAVGVVVWRFRSLGAADAAVAIAAIAYKVRPRVRASGGAAPAAVTDDSDTARLWAATAEEDDDEEDVLA